MKKFKMPGILSGMLFTLAWGCAEPQFLEDVEQSGSSSTMKLRPFQSYLVTYQEEVITVKPRVRLGILGKATNDYQEAPILTKYEKCRVIAVHDSTGSFRIEKQFIDGTYDGNAYPPENLGFPKTTEIQKSKQDIDNEIVKTVFDETGITEYTRGGKVNKYVPNAEEINLRNEWKRRFSSVIDSLKQDTTSGIYGKKFDLFKQIINEQGGTVSDIGTGLLSIVNKDQANGTLVHTVMDRKTGNVFQDAVFTNGKLDLYTQYNYVLRSGKWVPNAVHSRLFSDFGKGPEIISETIESCTNIKVMPR